MPPAGKRGCKASRTMATLASWLMTGIYCFTFSFRQQKSVKVWVYWFRVLKVASKNEGSFSLENTAMTPLLPEISSSLSQYRLLQSLKPDHKVTTYKVGAEPLSVRMSLGCCGIVMGELEPEPELADDTLGGRISGRQSAAEPTCSGS